MKKAGLFTRSGIGVKGRRLRLFLVVNRRKVLRVTAALCVLVGIGLSLTIVSLPYYVFRPGDVRLGAEAVEIRGVDLHVPENGISYVTVSVQGPLSPLDWMAAGLNEDLTIVPESIFNRDLSVEERREDDLRLMKVSHEVAKFVAFKELGFDLASLVEIIILGVVPCSAADGMLGVGDTILGAYGESLQSIADLQGVIKQQKIGDVLDLKVRSLLSGATQNLRIPLGARGDPCLGGEIAAEDPDSPFLGVTLEERAQSIDVCLTMQVCVEFDVGNVGGPSAGLVFALTIIDLLTPGDLTRGCRVAATGSILATGSVGRVGGLRQKAAAAERAGYDLMLVPLGQSIEARNAFSGRLVIKEVGSVKDAFKAFETCESIR